MSMAPDSKIGVGLSTPSSSTIAGTLLLGEIRRKSGSRCSPFIKLTVRTTYASPTSSSMMEAFCPLGVSYVNNSIIFAPRRLPAKSGLRRRPPSRTLFFFFERDRDYGICRQPDAVAFDVGHEALINVMMVPLVGALAAVGLLQLDATALDAVHRPDGDAVGADDLYAGLDLRHRRSHAWAMEAASVSVSGAFSTVVTRSTATAFAR